MSSRECLANFPDKNAALLRLPEAGPRRAPSLLLVAAYAKTAMGAINQAQRKGPDSLGAVGAGKGVSRN